MSDNFITNIKINKVRHLKSLEIKLSKDKRKHLILTGKNGSGKTSVLEGIVSYLKVIEEGQLNELVKYPQYLIDSEKRLNSLKNKDLKSDTDNANIEQFKSSINFYKKSLNRYGNGLSLEFNTIADLVSKYKNGSYILSYFDSNRSTNVTLPKLIEKINLKNNYGFQDKPSVNFVKYLVDLKTQQSFARNEGDLKVAEMIEEWFHNFESALRGIFEDETLKLKFNYRNYDFKIIEEGREPFGFDVLSDGYSSVLNIIMDLILRMEREKGYYSENQDRPYIYDVQGIVLIDEVETHLHIELQKKIMPFLIKLFPKIQFIVSTHSPFVLSSIDNAVIYDLENKIQVENLSKYSYEGIVESYFEVDQYSYAIKNKIQRYESLVNIKNKSEYEEDEMFDLRKYLKGISPELAPELVYKFREIELKRRGGEND